MSFFEISEF